MFRNLVAGAVLASAFVVFPAAAGNLSVEREAAMKDIGRNFGIVNRMNRGQNPYDGAAATEAFSGIAGSGQKFALLFPESDDESEAGRMVAQDRARFDELMKDFIADAGAAAETAGEGEESLKQAFRSVAANCAACHKVFRPD